MEWSDEFAEHSECWLCRLYLLLMIFGWKFIENRSPRILDLYVFFGAFMNVLRTNDRFGVTIDFCF